MFIVLVFIKYKKISEKLFAENKTSPLLKPQEKDFHLQGHKFENFLTFLKSFSFQTIKTIFEISNTCFKRWLLRRPKMNETIFAETFFFPNFKLFVRA